MTDGSSLRLPADSQNFVRQEFARTVRDGLAPTACVVGFFYCVLVPSHLLVASPESRLPLAGSALLSAFVCLGIWGRWRDRPPAIQHAYVLLALVFAILLANSALHLRLDPAPHQTTNFALLAVATGFLCLSHTWLATLLASNAATWAILAWTAPPAPGWVHFTFFFFMANAMAVTAHLLRVVGLRRLELSTHEGERARDALERSEANLRKAQNLVHLGSYEYEAGTGRARHWSDETFRIVGRDPALGAPPLKEYVQTIVHPEERERVEAALQQTMAGIPTKLEHRIVRPDGSVRHVEAIGDPIREPDGAVTWVGTLRDVTDRRLADQALQEQRAELIHAARLSTMGEMAAALAHELHQPLAAIVNYARGCSRRLASTAELDAPALQKALDEICGQAERSSEILRSLWRFARKGESTREWVKLEHIVRDVVRLVESEARRAGITVRLAPQETPIWVHAEAIQASQVLLNLIRNGIDSIQEHAASAKQLDIGARIRADDRVEVTVRDSGGGLSADMTEHLFEPFATTKATGLGLGLSVSRRIVESQGGRIWATHNAGGGTTFHFTLPGGAETSRNG